MDLFTFYKSARWLRKRKIVLARDRHLCQECKRYGKAVAAETVHHIKPLEECPDLALRSDNLISLCNKCHNAKHPEKAKKAKRAQGDMF